MCQTPLQHTRVLDTYCYSRHGCWTLAVTGHMGLQHLLLQHTWESETVTAHMGVGHLLLQHTWMSDTVTAHMGVKHCYSLHGNWTLTVTAHMGVRHLLLQHTWCQTVATTHGSQTLFQHTQVSNTYWRFIAHSSQATGRLKQVKADLFFFHIAAKSCKQFPLGFNTHTHPYLTHTPLPHTHTHWQVQLLNPQVIY